MKVLKKLTIITSTIYIIWRLFTLPIGINSKSIIFAIIFILLEIFDYFEFIVFYYNSLKSNNKNNKIKKVVNENEDVDIIVATINEPVELLTTTLLACTKIEWPNEKKHIYVCDDGGRKEIKELADSLNINYIKRDNNDNAKAGNYNNALRYLKSKFILTLDADMVPEKTILEDLMPYFYSKEVGFVQCPQVFKNPDIYQYRYKLEEVIPNDQYYFYSTLQPLKQNINAVVFCGTNAIIRREALDKIGGFATGTITEDIATGMLIQDAGYKGIYVNKKEAVGVQENSIDSFIKQRTRWERGCIQVAKKYNLFKLKGLSLKQKLEYLSCYSYWLFGIKRVFFLIAPILFSKFKIILINCDIIAFLLMWLPQYLLKRFVLDKMFLNKRSSTWNKIYEIILTPIFAIEAVKEIIGIKKKKFEVSQKNIKVKKSKYQKFLIGGHLIFLIINYIAYFESLWNINNMNLDILSLIWSLSNIGYLIIALIFDFSTKERNIKEYEEVEKYDENSLLKIFVRNKNEGC